MLALLIIMQTLSIRSIEAKSHPQTKGLFWHLFVGTRGGHNRVRIISQLRNKPSNKNQLAQDLKRKDVMTSNQLGESLLSCPFHIAVVTGDSCMLEPDNFGARVAFVDYDGKSTYDDYKINKPKTNSDEIEFVKRNAPLMVRSTESLKEWVNFIKSEI